MNWRLRKEEAAKAVVCVWKIASKKAGAKMRGLGGDVIGESSETCLRVVVPSDKPAVLFFEQGRPGFLSARSNRCFSPCE